MRYVSTFSGIEAASVAWGGLGWEPVAFSEVDPFPSAVLAHRFPDVTNLGDITKVDWRDYSGSVDLVVGGSPCQSFSVAGKREGLAGASGLMFEYIRCVQELMPRWFVWENVPGALSSEGGAAFGQLLTEMDELGYGLAWRVLDAQFFGVAQRRRRVFLVGSLGEGGARRACEVLFEPESLRWDPPSSREKRKELAARTGRRAEVAGGFKYHQGAGAGSIGYESEQSPTLTADWHNPAVVIGGDGPVRSYAIRMRGGCPGGGKGPLIQEEVSGTLATSNDQTVICMTDTQANCMVDGEVCGALTCHSRKDPPVVSGPVVRRLTPRECERLQGFPDDWTMVPYRGKSAEDCPDGPRYKAIGNSMAVPVMRWIGERIAVADTRRNE